jgi:3-oxoadipate enol-lactonase
LNATLGRRAFAGRTARYARIAPAAMLALACASCTDALLARYRDDAYLAHYEYALGEQYLTVSDVTMCYQDLGRGETVLVLPGLGTNADFWRLNVPVWAERYRMLVLDPPGFGKSDKPDLTYDLPRICDRIIAFLDAKRVARTHIIGGSMGGHLALLLALEHPDRVSSLVAMGSSGYWKAPGPLLDLGFKLFWNDAVVADHMRRAWPDIFDQLFAEQTPVTRSLLRYQMAVRAHGDRYRAEGRAFSRALRSIFYNSVRDRLQEVHQPTLLIWGEDDRIHPARGAWVFRDRIPDSRLVVVPGAYHEVMIDRPNVFNRLVLDFLERGTSAIEDTPRQAGVSAP